jgi:hypothetical protein
MTPSRKKPGVAFWATVVVAALIAYPVSFGPACWLTSRRTDRWTCPRAMIVYWPLGRAFEVMGIRRGRAGNPISSAGHEALMWWITVGLPKGGSAIAPTSPDLTKIMVVEPPRT